MGSNNSKNADYGNRHTLDSTDGGCPKEALVWVGEGNFAIGMKTEERYCYYGKNDSYINRANDLEAAGINQECWEGIIKRLQAKYCKLFKGDFKKEIESLNQEIFDPKGLIAIYSEYGGKGGQSAMCVVKKEVFEKYRDGSAFEINCSTK